MHNAGRLTKQPDAYCFHAHIQSRDLNTVSNSLHECIEVIEAGYEFLLAYAAQGRESDEGQGGSEVRTTLAGMSEAASAIAEFMGNDDGDFSTVILEDARKSVAAISLVLTQDKISSELIDNLNASIHLRALLTDLFLLSETLR
jgi:hypothetical protein